MASSCDRVVPLIADQMRPGTERAQMGVLGAVAEKQKKRHASHALLISWLGDSCAANKSVHASLRSLALASTRGAFTLETSGEAVGKRE